MATSVKARVFTGGMAILFLLTASAFTASVVYSIVTSKDSSSQNNSSQQQQDQQIKQQIYANTLPLKGYKATPFQASSVNKLITKDLKAGSGAVAKSSDKLTLSYFGWTPDGKIFDSSNKKDGSGQSFSFTPSDGGVIPGWIKGVPGMQVGGVRELTIPAAEAYGATGSPPIIPPNTPLKFIVRLDKIE